jgi:hypothetical protein
MVEGFSKCLKIWNRAQQGLAHCSIAIINPLQCQFQWPFCLTYPKRKALKVTLSLEKCAIILPKDKFTSSELQSLCPVWNPKTKKNRKKEKTLLFPRMYLKLFEIIRILDNWKVWRFFAITIVKLLQTQSRTSLWKYCTFGCLQAYPQIDNKVMHWAFHNVSSTHKIGDNKSK